MKKFMFENDTFQGELRVEKMFTWKSGVLLKVKYLKQLQILETKTMMNMLSVFKKKKLLVEHIPIEISSLCFHFLNQNVGNKIKAVITGKRHREIGLVVPAKLVFLTIVTRNK